MSLQANQRLQNKDFVVNQISKNKVQKKDDRNSTLKEERQIIQETVKDLNSKVMATKAEVLGDLGSKTMNNRKIIDRIGNKTSFFWIKNI